MINSFTNIYHVIGHTCNNKLFSAIINQNLDVYISRDLSEWRCG